MTIQGQASLLARVITAAAVVVTAITATATAAMLPALYRRSIASVVTAGIASALLGPRRPGAVQCLATTTSDLPPEPNRRRRLYDLRGKNVMVTGATTGIGRACAWAFAAEGSNLIIVGRRIELLSDLEQKLKAAYPSIKVLSLPMSVTDLQEVERLPATLHGRGFGDLHVLVNNAGLALGLTTVDKNDMKDAVTVLDTNVLSIIAMCRSLVPGMRERGEGHIINIGSVAGHYAYLMGTTYNASKYAVTGFTEAMRHDLVDTPVRCTLVSPGLVGNTEFSAVRLKDDVKAKAVYADIVHLDPEDVADNVVYAASRPEHVQMATMIVYATNQSGPRDVSRVGASLGKKEK